MKKNFHKYLLLCLPVTILLLTGCPKADPEAEAISLPAELKEYSLFKPGTYWIYRDSASKQLDSVWVVTTEISILRQGRSTEPPIKKHETFVTRTRSSRGGPDHVINADRRCGWPGREDVATISGLPDFPCWTVRRGLVLPNSTADEGDTDVFAYRIERDKATFLNVTNAVMYPYWHSTPVIIGGVAYNDVLEVKLTADASEYGWKGHYAWAPNVGIVRHRVWRGYDLRTWTLLRSRIVQ